MSAHARKFAAAYFALAGIFGVAIGLFVVLAQQSAPGPPPPWSAWTPSGSTATQKTAQIASHIGAQYHLPGGQQLVGVRVGGPGAPADPIRAVAIARTLNPQQSDIVAEGPVDDASIAMYQLCGNGTHCAITEGKPTTARAGVLRREALELALYTFRYAGVSSVVTFFPPAMGQPQKYAFLFSRDTYVAQLREPLGRTLSKQRAPKADTLAPAERTLVDQLTRNSFFVFGLQRLNDGGRVLVLAPPPAFR